MRQPAQINSVENDDKKQTALRQRIWRCLRRAALFLAVILGAKLIWFLLMAPPRAGSSAEDARADVAMRRNYLLKRVASEEFGVADMPLLVASPYRQELAIGTLSASSPRSEQRSNVRALDPGLAVLYQEEAARSGQRNASLACIPRGRGCRDSARRLAGVGFDVAAAALPWVEPRSGMIGKCWPDCCAPPRPRDSPGVSEAAAIPARAAAR